MAMQIYLPTFINFAGLPALAAEANRTMSWLHGNGQTLTQPLQNQHRTRLN